MSAHLVLYGARPKLHLFGCKRALRSLGARTGATKALDTLLLIVSFVTTVTLTAICPEDSRCHWLLDW
jgi:hypothetical protein